VKFEAFIHLTNNLAYVMMIALSLMMPFALYLRVNKSWEESLLLDLPFFLGATVSVCCFYLVSQREVGGTWAQRIRYLPFVLGLGIGLAVNNAKATLEALFGHESPFIRTPKLAVESDGKRVKAAKGRYRAGRNLLPYFELFLGLYYTGTVVYCIIAEIWLAVPFMLLFQFGFLYTGLMSLFQWQLGRKSTAATA
jgi:hypothetical protein